MSRCEADIRIRDCKLGYPSICCVLEQGHKGEHKGDIDEFGGWVAWTDENTYYDFMMEGEVNEERTL